MSERPAPILHSDFDGTAIVHRQMWHPANWTKSHSRLMPGYTDFLNGVQCGGVELGRIVMRRPDPESLWHAQRRLVTGRNMVRLGLDKYFAPKGVVYTGSETAKGHFIAEASRDGVVGMIDDKPLGLVRGILEHMPKVGRFWESDDEIVIGAVSGAGHASIRHVARLALEGASFSAYYDDASNHLTVTGQHMRLQVIPVTLDTQAGIDFAQVLLDTTT